MSNSFDVLANQAEEYSRALNETTTPRSEFIISGLNHRYDVIVSETLDYLIYSERLTEFSATFLELCEHENSYLVTGRLRLIAALIRSDQMRTSLSNIDHHNDLYYDVWLNAAMAIESGRAEFLLKLHESARSADMTISSLSNSLISFLENIEPAKR